MQNLIDETRAALHSGAFALGLTGAMTLVDICGALASHDGRATGANFRAWFTEHLSGRYPRFSADDAYRLRCGIVHQGRASSKQYSAVAFTIPNDKLRVRMHNVIMGDVYLLDLLQFSEDVLNAVGGWWESAKDTEPVADNAKDMLRVRIGLPGFIEGLPLLA